MAQSGQYGTVSTTSSSSSTLSRQRSFATAHGRWHSTHWIGGAATTVVAVLCSKRPSDTDGKYPLSNGACPMPVEPVDAGENFGIPGVFGVSPRFQPWTFVWSYTKCRLTTRNQTRVAA